MLGKLKSRKLWAAVAGAAFAAFASSMGVPDPIVAKVTAILIAYIAGQSIVDAAAAAKGNKSQGS